MALRFSLYHSREASIKTDSITAGRFSALFSKGLSFYTQRLVIPIYRKSGQRNKFISRAAIRLELAGRLLYQMFGHLAGLCQT